MRSSLASIIPDFLIDPSRCADPGFGVPSAEQHREITLNCLGCMSTHLKWNICSITEGWRLNREVENMDILIETHIPPELRYSCMYWASHLSKAVSSSALLLSLRSIFFAHALHWIETLSLLGQLSVAVSSLGLVKTWCDVSRTYHPLDRNAFPISSSQQAPVGDDPKTLIYDVDRVTVDPIQQGALQVYHSALPFKPQDTLLYQNFRHELDRTVQA
jgi:hypothetical protein